MPRSRLRSRPQIAVPFAVIALVIAVLPATMVAGRGTVHQKKDYLAAAETAYSRSSAWWDARRHWYRQFLHGGGKQPLATMWGIVHQFEVVDALAIANPTPRRIAAVRAFAKGAESYWNPNLKPVPAYGPSPGERNAHGHAWYDDEAWWGIAFYDAFRATHDRRYLASADRSLTFLDSGWDPRRGGIYWDNNRTFKSSESLAGATLIAADLYRETHSPRYLAMAKKYIGWANSHIRAKDGLYGARSTPARPMPYVEGPMAEALMVLCKTTGNQSYCRSGEDLAGRAADHFTTLTMGPQYDSMYIRSLLEIYRFDHNPRWYRIATSTADRAMANAATSNGLYMLTWDGRPIRTIGTAPGKLQTHAATTSVLAWVAAAR